MMQRFVSLFCSVLVLLPVVEISTTAQQNHRTTSDQTTLTSCKQPCLEDGTPVKLRFAQTVSSADAHVDDRVEFEVLEEIKISDTLIVPKGGIAWGTVTEAEPKRRMARGGKLEIVMDSVRLTDGEKAALRATKDVKGGGHTGAMTAGIVATGLLFWPAAPFFLFMHGKDISIPKGTELPTFVSGNFSLDLAKFQQNTQGTTQMPQAGASATVSISSSPTGADISVDQSFVGNTPSSISLSAGKHVISVSKQGYKDWERGITLLGGTVNLSADLVPGTTVQIPAASANTSAGIARQLDPSRPTDSQPTGEGASFSASAAPASNPTTPAVNTIVDNGEPHPSMAASQPRVEAKTATDAPIPANAVAARGQKSLAILNGTPIVAMLRTGLDARLVHAGDTVDVEATENIKQGGEVRIRKGTTLNGHVTLVQRFAAADKPCIVAILFDKVTVSAGEQLLLNASIQALASPIDVQSETLVSGRGMDQNAVDAEYSSMARPIENDSKAVRLDASAGSPERISQKSVGTYGMPHVTLGYEKTSAGYISVVTSSANDLRLKKGTQLVMRVVAQ